MTTPPDPRAYPDRPFLAVSAAILREGRVLLVRRARSPAQGLFTLPGGVVESGEMLIEALQREIREETQLRIQPASLAGHREVIVRDDQGRVMRHFIILAFAAQWIAGEPVLNEELAEARWVRPEEVDGFQTTEGLSEIIREACRQIEAAHREAACA